MRYGPHHPYEVIVCGAGHAGCEAALAAARMGADTLLLTGNIDTTAQMSCNPAIGGLAKGHIVREIDALGGEMAINADTTGIQFRLLNASKGPAVQAPRVQSDKKAYQCRMKYTVELQPHLSLFQAMGTHLIYKGNAVVGVGTALGIEFYGKAVVIATGTFLRAIMHVGQNKNRGGRMGDFSAQGLSNSLLQAGIQLQRFKTGTPPRILGSSIDFSRCQEQKGDEKPVCFAFYDTRPETELFHVEHSDPHKLGWLPGKDQVSCWITYTSEETAKVVRDNLHLSPLYSGAIAGTGPRYCPSIEDKYVKFADKTTHRIFLEPEGRHTDEWYLNGLSTSLPLEVQTKILPTIAGLERAQLIRPAYAVEYDFAPPTQIYPSLESKKIENLFFAGQINGTSGYEEAAAQGLVAGVNAVCKVRKKPPMIIGRHEGYIGVLIDDLVTKGTQEPYRMFTSRAEYRLLFNHGSAELRLYEHAKEEALLSSERLERIKEKRLQVEKWTQKLEADKGIGGTLGDCIRRDMRIPFPKEFERLSESTREQVLYQVRYRGYLERELRWIDKMQHLENIRIPDTFDFSKVISLRTESLQKLQAIRPQNLGQASRISGINPTDISLLMVILAKK